MTQPPGFKVPIDPDDPKVVIIGFLEARHSIYTLTCDSCHRRYPVMSSTASGIARIVKGNRPPIHCLVCIGLASGTSTADAAAYIRNQFSNLDAAGAKHLHDGYGRKQT